MLVTLPIVLIWFVVEEALFKFSQVIRWLLFEVLLFFADPDLRLWTITRICIRLELI